MQKSLMTDDSRDSYDKLTKKNRKKLPKYSKTAIKYLYLCNVKIKMRGDALAREKNLPRALRNSAACTRKTNIGMATTRVK